MPNVWDRCVALRDREAEQRFGSIRVAGAYGESLSQFRQPFGIGREHYQVVHAGLDRLTRGFVAGRAYPAPSQGDLVGGP